MTNIFHASEHPRRDGSPVTAAYPGAHPPSLLLIGLSLVLAAIVGCNQSPVMTTYTEDNWTETFPQVGFIRMFHVHVPARPELGPAAPLILAFHGLGQTGQILRAQTELDRAAAEHGFIVVYLQAGMGAWDIFDDLEVLGLDELAYVREVIDRVTRRYVVDQHRIVAVGFSNGGVMAQRLGCELPHRITGFVSVAATMPRRLADGCQPDRPINALYLVGTNDRQFPAGGGGALLSIDGTMSLWAGVNRCEGRRSTARLPELHDDGTTVFRSGYGSCRNGTRVWLDSIAGGGHTWPGRDAPPSELNGITSRNVSANLEIARFLAGLRRD